MAEGESGKNDQKQEENSVSHDPVDELQEIENMVLNPNINVENLVEEASNEYEHLNKTLDEIDSWMTTLESRNDSLYSQLQELLKSSKETRQELQMMNECQESNGKTDGDKTKS